ncbi:hypothetical protein HLY00_244 [Mycolicibacterium hippocampi]|uniref:PE-PPE domain-containing protein n=1 Tax=Mycolicibacterium hippocampi TaxID=659824 RepID=A0A850PJT1_9MYCO|nr:PE-PPE domain-containing protein [Mycolicibacterium hippocampi]NVN48823.1 hypothetical protein [Mycolicibacterium hippocampi]
MKSRSGTKPRAQAGAVAVAASLCLLATPGASAAAEVVALPGPATVLTLGIVPGSNHDDLQGVVCQSPNTCEAVRYPSVFYPSGADPLNQKLQETSGLKIVYGYSQGGQVISAWMRKYAAAEDAPPADELLFVIIANGDRRYGGSNARSGYVMPETQYRVIDISRQYDFGSDYPNGEFNLLAMANAIAGFGSIHTDYESVDINDPANIVWTEGKTTYVFVPTEQLPLLRPLRMLGFGKLADELNGPLKEIIERGYNRDYLPKPVGPSDPAEPNPPAEPTEPAEPGEPTGPAEPTEPAEPAEPTEPAGPTEPVGPAAPAEPAEPTESAEPTKPAELANSVESSELAGQTREMTGLSDEEGGEPVVGRQSVTSFHKRDADAESSESDDSSRRALTRRSEKQRDASSDVSVSSTGSLDTDRESGDDSVQDNGS